MTKKKRKTRKEKEKAQLRQETIPIQPNTAHTGKHSEIREKYEEYFGEILHKDFYKYNWISDMDSMRDKILLILDHLYDEHIFVMQQKYFLLLGRFLDDCDNLYGQILKKDSGLQDLTRKTIVNYYKPGFLINQSREISFLPLDLRVFIYTNLLRNSSLKIDQVHLLNRVALTIQKMEIEDYYNYSVFVFSYASCILFKTCNESDYGNWFQYFGYTGSGRKPMMSHLMRENYRNFNQSGATLRERTLKSAELDGARKIEQELWYGINGFSHMKNIKDMKAAKICLKLFVRYFEKVYLKITDWSEKVLLYYESGDNQALNQFMQERMLDDVNMNSYIIQTYLTAEGLTADAVVIKNGGDLLPNIITQNDRNLLFFSDTETEKYIFDYEHLKPSIAPQDYYSEIEWFVGILKTKNNIVTQSIEDYIIHLTTAILNNDCWDEKIQYLIVMILRGFSASIWNMLGEKQVRKDINVCWERAFFAGKEENIIMIGTAIPRAFFCTWDKMVVLCSDETEEPASLTISIADNYTSYRKVIEMLDVKDKKIFHPLTIDCIFTWYLKENILPQKERDIRRSGWNHIFNKLQNN